MAHTAHQRDDVLLEAHAGAAPVSEAAAGQFVADLLDRDLEAGREALDHHDERWSVGFAGGEVAEHGANLPGRRGPDEAHQEAPMRFSDDRMASLRRMAMIAPRASHGPNGNALLARRTISTPTPTTTPMTQAKIRA